MFHGTQYGKHWVIGLTGVGKLITRRIPALNLECLLFIDIEISVMHVTRNILNLQF